MDEMMTRFRLEQLNTPCTKCLKMPHEHDSCPCLVNGCIGYQINERCHEKLPSILKVEGPYGIGPAYSFYEDKIVEGKATIWDPKSTIIFQGPQRTAQYSFEIHENIVKRILRKLRILKKKQSLINEDWNPDIIASMRKDLAQLGWNDEFTLAKHEPDIFKIWIERIEKDR